jgi:diguanylate cyclase (GGDEF)-like protein
VRVLVAEDDPVARTVLVALLRNWDFEVTAVNDGAAAADILTGTDSPPIAILDWEMPGLDGPALCRRVRERRDEVGPYLILLTARGGRDSLVQGFDSGADCFLTKPFDRAELQAQLGAARRIAARQEALFQEREALRHRSLHDGLTGLLNRTGTMEALENAIADVTRNGGSIGVAMVDLDHFKRINDTWGHSAGDEVLAEGGRRLRASLRPYDQVGRVGGEEFLLIVPRCDREGLRRVAERVRAVIADTPFATHLGELPVTTSLGISWMDLGQSAEQLLLRADKALYRAKRQGRNRVVDFDDPEPVQPTG